MTEKEAPRDEELPSEADELSDADLDAVIGGVGAHGRHTVGEAG
ncbi:MAG: hypothetical protein WCP26_00375 [Actinomycetes bacterium]